MRSPCSPRSARPKVRARLDLQRRIDRFEREWAAAEQNVRQLTAHAAAQRGAWRSGCSTISPRRAAGATDSAPARRNIVAGTRRSKRRRASRCRSAGEKLALLDQAELRLRDSFQNLANDNPRRQGQAPARAERARARRPARSAEGAAQGIPRDGQPDPRERPARARHARAGNPEPEAAEPAHQRGCDQPDARAQGRFARAGRVGRARARARARSVGPARPGATTKRR